ncbi:MAG: L-seryl-tRNA(Sec) selenium transferase [Actinomycetales bacterium]
MRAELDDPRRAIPRTDTLLADPRLEQASRQLGRQRVLDAVRSAQHRARIGQIAATQVLEAALEQLPGSATTLTPVLNATGVVVHTNIGRAPLSAAARQAVAEAAGYVDVELDLADGARAGRGRGMLAALRHRVPEAGDALVVNNGAAALVLATTALAAGREVVVSRGELIEIGDGFRLPALIESTGARLVEVGTTNRTHLADYADAVGAGTGCILKVHPSNFTMSGFTRDVPVGDLAGLGVPVVMDIGSGLLRPDPTLPDEPDAATALAAGAHLVTASGDKLLGGPQAGLVLGEAGLVQRLRRHPLARALRVDKLTIAALEATLSGPAAPVHEYLHVSQDALRDRVVRLHAGLGQGEVVPVQGRVGGGGAPGVPLPGWALALPARCARDLRTGDPAVLARVEHDRCLIDLRCIDPQDDERVIAAVRAVLDDLPGE